MGDDSGEFEREKPAHPVRVSAFYISKFLITQGQWQAIIDDNPSHFKGENHPVESVSWNQAQDFIRQLNKITDRQFRLPTEAEWEYAARGGKYSLGYTYSGSDKLKQVGWYDDNSGNKTHEVGMMLANELGLYDMSGNVWEWCADWYDEQYYKECKDKGVVENPSGSDAGVYRVLRGGSSFNHSVYCRSTYRGRRQPGYHVDYIGFRLVVRSQSVG